MTRTGSLLNMVLIVSAMLLPTAAAQDERGKAELKVSGGVITIDYGRPSLKGRDMLSKLAVGDSWRLGKDEVTTITTPVDLMFGSTRIAKGTYGLWLKRTQSDRYDLVFNRQTTSHAMKHDTSIDVAAVPMTKSEIKSPVETLTIGLQPEGGGSLVVEWGNVRLTTRFTAAGGGQGLVR